MRIKFVIATNPSRTPIFNALIPSETYRKSIRLFFPSSRNIQSFLQSHLFLEEEELEEEEEEEGTRHLGNVLHGSFLI